MLLQVVIEKRAKLNAKADEQVIRLANLAGIENPEERLPVDVPATIKLYDPPQYELIQDEARAALIEESLEVLEGQKSQPEQEGTTAPKKRGRPRKNPEE